MGWRRCARQAGAASQDQSAIKKAVIEPRRGVVHQAQFRQRRVCALHSKKRGAQFVMALSSDQCLNFNMGDKAKTGLATIEMVGGPCCGEIYQSTYPDAQRFFSVRLVDDIHCAHPDHDSDESQDGVLAADPLAVWFTYEKRYKDELTGYWIFTPKTPQVQL